MATLNRKDCEEHPRSNQGQNSGVPISQEDYITQVSEENEGRVTRKLSQEFCETENRKLGALSRLDDFLMNTLVQGYYGTAPATSGNAFGTNQGRNEDDSQSDTHPEASIFRSQTTQNSGPEVGHDNQNKKDETRNVENLKMATFRYWGLAMTGERALITCCQDIPPHKRTSMNFLHVEFQFKTFPCNGSLQSQKTWQKRFTRHNISNGWTITVKAKFRCRQPRQHACWIRRCIATQQWPLTSTALFKRTTANTLVLDGKKGTFERFEDLFQAMFEIKPDTTEAMKINIFPSHFRDDALQIFHNFSAGGKQTFEDELFIIRQKCVSPWSQATNIHKMHKFILDPKTNNGPMFITKKQQPSIHASSSI